jgi:hypothetical protein
VDAGDTGSDARDPLDMGRRDHDVFRVLPECCNAALRNRCRGGDVAEDALVEDDQIVLAEPLPDLRVSVADILARASDA